MERIFDGASGDSEQRHDNVDKPESLDSQAAKSAERDSLAITFSPVAESTWKSENESQPQAEKDETLETPVVEFKKPAVSEPESRPVLLREIEPNDATEPARSRAAAMMEEEYCATEYGLHFPITAAGSGGNDGGTPPPKETVNAEPSETKPPTSAWTEVKSLARDVAFAAITAILIVVFVVQPVKVEGTSMLPQLENGERIFVNKFIYSFDSIHRGDIVVFWYPDNPSQSFIKRVIGLPGDTIKVVSGHVYINDKLYNEPYLSRDRTQQMYNFGPEKVKQYHYFVMGDNRDASNDSRAWGEVPEKYIYGKAMFRYWPLSSFGSIPAQADDSNQ